MSTVGKAGYPHFCAIAQYSQKWDAPDGNTISQLNMLDALRAYDKDKGLKEMMGDEFSAAFLKMKHREWNSFVSHFLRWEKENTLDI